MTVPTHAIAMASTTLAAAAYDDRQALLHVEFRDGTCYQYAGVPASVFRDLLSADSKGAFFNRYIRTSYRYVRLAQCAGTLI
jgi:hypothetical protein